MCSTPSGSGGCAGGAGMSAFMTSRIAAGCPVVWTPAGPAGPGRYRVAAAGFVHRTFATAMSQSMLLPAFVALFGIVAALFLVDFTGAAVGKSRCPDPMATLTMTTMSSTSFVGNRKRIATPSRCGRRARQRRRGVTQRCWGRWRSAESDVSPKCPRSRQAVGRGRQILSQQLRRAHYSRAACCARRPRR